MRRNIAIIGSGVALGLSHLLMGLGMRSTWPVIFALVVFTLEINGLSIGALLRKPNGLTEGRMSRIWSFFMVYSSIHLIRSFAEHALTSDFSSIPWIAPDTFIKNLGFSIIIATVFVYSRTLSLIDAFAVLIIGVGSSAGINLALDSLGYFADNNVYGESRFEGLQSRWRPPLSKSNAFFGMTCTVAVGLTVHILWEDFKSLFKHPLILVTVSLCGLLSAWAAVRCQFRAHLLAVVTAFLLLMVRSTHFLRISGLAAVTAMVLFPMLFISDLGYMVLNSLAPEQILLKLGSSSEGSDTLSDRTYLYKYGWDNLSQPLIFAFGEGPVLRDAQGAVGDLPMIAYKMPYHAGFLDFVMQSGLPIATALSACIWLLVLAGCGVLTKQLDSGAQSAIRLGMVNLVMWLSLSITDSGLSNFETLWLAVIPLLGALIASRTTRPSFLGSSNVVNRAHIQLG